MISHFFLFVLFCFCFFLFYIMGTQNGHSLPFRESASIRKRKRKTMQALTFSAPSRFSAGGKTKEKKKRFLEML